MHTADHQTPHSHRGSNLLSKLMFFTILILLSVIAGGYVYFTRFNPIANTSSTNTYIGQQGQGGGPVNVTTAPTTSQSVATLPEDAEVRNQMNQTNDTSEGQSTEPNVSTSQTQKVGTSFDGVYATLDRVSRTRSGVIVNFTLVCEKEQCDDINGSFNGFKDDRYGKQSTLYDIFESYMVDEDSLTKYQVLKDANNRYIASEPTSQYNIKKDQKYSYSVTFANPPTDVKAVSIYITGVQAFTNVEI